jgi:CHRD domain
MRKTVMLVLAFAVCALIVGGTALAAKNSGSTKTINVKLTGKVEVPKGSPTGSGTAVIKLEPSKGKVCFTLTWKKIDTVTASHIHKGAKGTAGNIVVAFFGNPPAKHSGCVKAAKSLIQAIEKKPSAYYVNVHTKKYPAGAIRGQL